MGYRFHHGSDIPRCNFSFPATIPLFWDSPAVLRSIHLKMVKVGRSEVILIVVQQLMSIRSTLRGCRHPLQRPLLHKMIATTTRTSLLQLKTRSVSHVVVRVSHVVVGVGLASMITLLSDLIVRLLYTH